MFCAKQQKFSLQAFAAYGMRYLMMSPFSFDNINSKFCLKKTLITAKTSVYICIKTDIMLIRNYGICNKLTNLYYKKSNWYIPTVHMPRLQHYCKIHHCTQFPKNHHLVETPIYYHNQSLAGHSLLNSRITELGIHYNIYISKLIYSKYYIPLLA